MSSSDNIVCSRGSGRAPGSGTRGPQVNVAALEAMRVMEGPITAARLAEALGKPLQYCALLVWNFTKKKGWLKKTARGQYERTEAFPLAKSSVLGGLACLESLVLMAYANLPSDISLPGLVDGPTP